MEYKNLNKSQLSEHSIAAMILNAFLKMIQMEVIDFDNFR